MPQVIHMSRSTIKRSEETLAVIEVTLPSPVLCSKHPHYRIIDSFHSEINDRDVRRNVEERDIVDHLMTSMYDPSESQHFGKIQMYYPVPLQTKLLKNKGITITRTRNKIPHR